MSDDTYKVRKCRNHWHVYIEGRDEDGDVEQLDVDNGNMYTEQQAIDRAATLNAKGRATTHTEGEGCNR